MVKVTDNELSLITGPYHVGILLANVVERDGKYYVQHNWYKKEQEFEIIEVVRTADNSGAVLILKGAKKIMVRPSPILKEEV